MLTIIFSALVIGLLYFKLIKPLFYWKKLNVPYLTPWPIVGNVANSVFQLQSLQDTLSELYNAGHGKRYIGLYTFTEPVLMIRDPELIKQITVKEFDAFPDHRGLIGKSGLDPIAERSLFNLTRDQGWQDMRATLSPSFTSSKMKLIFLLIDNCAEQLVVHFQKQKDFVEVNLKDVLTKITNDVIATTAFGIECNTLENENNEFYLQGKKASDFSGELKSLLFFAANSILTKVLKVRFFSNENYLFFKDIVSRTIEYRKKENIVRPDMLHLLMEAQKGRIDEKNQNDETDSGFAAVEESNLGKKIKANIDVDDITAQGVTFFIAGFEAVASVMCLALYELALHPDYQHRLYEEIQETLQNCNNTITYEHLLKMKYLDCVVTEIMRLRTPAAILDRKSAKPFTIKPELEGEQEIHLPAGSLIWIPAGSIQMDPQYFPNPSKFDPERFNDENKSNIQPYTYMPFGSGPRNCIGSRFALLEMKLVLFKFLQHFEVVPVEKTPIPFKYPTGTFNLTPKEGFWLGVKKRAAA